MQPANNTIPDINNLEQLLQNQKYNIRQLSIQSGVPYATCYNLIKKQKVTNMTVANFHKIALSLGVTMDGLLTLIQKANINSL